MNNVKKIFLLCKKCYKYWGVFRKTDKLRKCSYCGSKIDEFTPVVKRELHKIFDGFYKINKPVKAVYVESNKIYGYCRLVIELNDILNENKDDLKIYGLPDSIKIVELENKSVLIHYFVRKDNDEKGWFWKAYIKVTKDIYRFTKKFRKKMKK